MPWLGLGLLMSLAWLATDCECLEGMAGWLGITCKPPQGHKRNQSLPSDLPFFRHKAEKNPNRSAKPTKTGQKCVFDLTGLNEAHRQDIADSAQGQDNRIELEVKCTELEFEREKNKKHKLELEAEQMRMEREDCQEHMQHDEKRDNRFFSMMSGMMGGGSGMQASSSMSNSSGTSNYRFDDDFSTWNLNTTQ
ncbi:hypothetical protein K438DRAFT_1956755 [Mycena galopus ATCC 62051]|nr:hypothetical protein K438DRAFT_1956755 [Mycena galopus ATCC 62051]